jgi:predicted CXXCH cytochrome family protein
MVVKNRSMPRAKENILFFTPGFFCVTLFIALLMGVIQAVHATDPPHDPVNLPQDCMDCHISHSAPGLGLTKEANNGNLCQSCHKDITRFGQWQSNDQTIPGHNGTSHRWYADADNPAYGAQLPRSPELSDYIDDGKITCVICHDSHDASAPGGSIYVSPIEKVTDGGGTGTVTVGPPAEDASARHYRIEIVQDSPTPAFRVSHDDGTSWFGWEGGSWSPGHAEGKPTGTDVDLTDGANIKVDFSGTFAIGDQFSFSVYRPLLRTSNDSSELCLKCHRERNQTAEEQRGRGDGVKVFSHPVGETLKPGTYHATPLDADGSADDGNSTNDLRLGTGGQVYCMTCHQPHGADSNSLTEDPK